MVQWESDIEMQFIIINLILFPVDINLRVNTFCFG